MRYRVFAKRKRDKGWKFVDAFDSLRPANDLVKSYRDAGWQAFTTNKQQLRSNPGNVSAEAQQLYRGFTGRSPDRLQRIRVSDLSSGAIVAGTVFEIRYISARDGKPYKHPFRVKSRPLLVSASDGKTVLIVGGRFAFTDRGFVDK